MSLLLGCEHCRGPCYADGRTAGSQASLPRAILGQASAKQIDRGQFPEDFTAAEVVTRQRGYGCPAFSDVDTTGKGEESPWLLRASGIDAVDDHSRDLSEPAAAAHVEQPLHASSYERGSTQMSIPNMKQMTLEPSANGTLQDRNSLSETLRCSSFSLMVSAT